MDYTKGKSVALFGFLVVLIIFINRLQRKIASQNEEMRKFNSTNWISFTILTTLASYTMYILTQNLRNCLI